VINNETGKEIVGGVACDQRLERTMCIDGWATSVFYCLRGQQRRQRDSSPSG